MSDTARSTPPPTEPVSDAELEDERSTIRTRVLRPSTLPPLLRKTTPPPADQAAAHQKRRGRIDMKVRIAQILMEDLPENDPQARLLRVAIVRRDEVLIDGILNEIADRVRR